VCQENLLVKNIDRRGGVETEFVKNQLHLFLQLESVRARIMADFGMAISWYTSYQYTHLGYTVKVIDDYMDIGICRV